MNFLITKYVKIFSNGSLIWCKKCFIKFNFFIFIKKDLFSLKKKVNKKKEFKSLLNYTTKYLKL